MSKVFNKVYKFIYFHSLPDSKVHIWIPFITFESILNFKKIFFSTFLNFNVLIVVKVSDLAISFIQLFHILTLDLI